MLVSKLKLKTLTTNLGMAQTLLDPKEDQSSMAQALFDPKRDQLSLSFEFEFEFIVL